MSKRSVWVSDAMINVRMLRPITHSFDDGLGSNRDIYTKAYYENMGGEALPPEYFPPEIFVKKDADTNYDTLPDLFFAGSYWVVSGGGGRDHAPV